MKYFKLKSSLLIAITILLTQSLSYGIKNPFVRGSKGGKDQGQGARTSDQINQFIRDTKKEIEALLRTNISDNVKISDPAIKDYVVKHLTEYRDNMRENGKPMDQIKVDRFLETASSLSTKIESNSSNKKDKDFLDFILGSSALSLKSEKLLKENGIKLEQAESISNIVSRVVREETQKPGEINLEAIYTAIRNDSRFKNLLSEESLRDSDKDWLEKFLLCLRALGLIK